MARLGRATPHQKILTKSLVHQNPAGPLITYPTETSITSTTVTIGCNTDTPGSGTLYYYISTSATKPTASDLKDGTSSVKFGNQPNPTDPETFDVTGLSAGTTYYSYFIHNA